MDTRQIEDLHRQGYTQYEISRLTGYSQPTISIALQSMNFKGWRMDYKIIKNPVIKEFCLQNDMSIKMFANIIGCSKDKALALLEGEREVRFSVAEFQRLLKSMGKSFEEVFG